MNPFPDHTFTCKDAKGDEQKQTTQIIEVRVMQKKEKWKEQQVNLLKETKKMGEEDIQKMED